MTLVGISSTWLDCCTLNNYSTCDKFNMHISLTFTKRWFVCSSPNNHTYEKSKDWAPRWYDTQPINRPTYVVPIYLISPLSSSSSTTIIFNIASTSRVEVQINMTSTANDLKNQGNDAFRKVCVTLFRSIEVMCWQVWLFVHCKINTLGRGADLCSASTHNIGIFIMHVDYIYMNIICLNMYLILCRVVCAVNII